MAAVVYWRKAAAKRVRTSCDPLARLASALASEGESSRREFVAGRDAHW
jgi:hypothetical protein